MVCLGLHPFQIFDSQIAARIAGVERADGFDHQDVAFVFGHRFVLDAFGHYQHFALFERGRTFTKRDLHLAVDDDENFIGFGVTVPDELALDLGNFEVVIVHLGDDLGRPILAEFSEFFLKIYGLRIHRAHLLFFQRIYQGLLLIQSHPKVALEDRQADLINSARVGDL